MRYGDPKYCTSGNIRAVSIFKNPAKITFIIALLRKNENLLILNFVKRAKTGNHQTLNTQKLPDLQYESNLL